MFSAGGTMMIAGILMGVVIIALSLYGVSRLFKDANHEMLVKFILLIFTSLVALYIVDKLIAFKINLLPEEQNKELFDLIKTLVLMIFSYYFVTKSDRNAS